MIEKPVTKCDSGTQTDTHLLETNIVKSYEWNEWELRRKAIKLVHTNPFNELFLILVLRAGFWFWLYQFLVIAYILTSQYSCSSSAISDFM